MYHSAAPSKGTVLNGDMPNKRNKYFDKSGGSIFNASTETPLLLPDQSSEELNNSRKFDSKVNIAKL